MAQQQEALQNTTADPNELADTISRLAAKLSDVSAELDQLSQRLRVRHTGEEPARRPGPAREPEEQPPEAAGVTMGEPVDTSYTSPVQTPAASAAGAFPSPGGAVRWIAERVNVIVWVGSALALLGVFTLLLVLARM